MDDVPHIALPIQVAGLAYRTVQQDTNDEVACAVAAIAGFPLGYRDEAPEFGIDQLEFTGQPLDLADLDQACETYEPRARLRLTQTPYDPNDPTAVRVTVEVAMHTAEDV